MYRPLISFSWPHTMALEGTGLNLRLGPVQILRTSALSVHGIAYQTVLTSVLLDVFVQSTLLICHNIRSVLTVLIISLKLPIYFGQLSAHFVPCCPVLLHTRLPSLYTLHVSEGLNDDDGDDDGETFRHLCFRIGLHVSTLICSFAVRTLGILQSIHAILCIKKVKERIVLREFTSELRDACTCQMGPHSVICYPTEVAAPPSPQPGRLVLDLSTP